MDVHIVKERGANGAVVTVVEAHHPGARTLARALPAQETSFDVVRLNLRSICPPAVPAEGGPCASYSGLRIRPCSARCIGFEELRCARAPTNRQARGRLNPAGSALSAVAICDALNSIGVLSWRAETSSAGAVFGRNTTNSHEARAQQHHLSANGAVSWEVKRIRSAGIPSSFHTANGLGRACLTAGGGSAACRRSRRPRGRR